MLGNYFFSFIHSFIQAGRALLFSEYGWCFVFNSTFTLLLWQGGKGECKAARCKGTAGQGTWQMSDLILFPSGRHTSSVWQSVRKQVPMATWQVQRSDRKGQQNTTAVLFPAGMMRCSIRGYLRKKRWKAFFLLHIFCPEKLLLLVLQNINT